MVVSSPKKLLMVNQTVFTLVYVFIVRSDLLKIVTSWFLFKVNARLVLYFPR